MRLKLIVAVIICANGPVLAKDSGRDEIKTNQVSVTCASKPDMDAIYKAAEGTLFAYMGIVANLIKKDRCRVMPSGATLYLQRKVDMTMLGDHELCLFTDENGKNCYWISSDALDLSKLTVGGTDKK